MPDTGNDKHKKGSFFAAAVSMPFAPAEIPSIQVGIIKALLQNRGWECDDLYAYVDFYLKLKENGLNRIYNSTMPGMVSEWIFSPKSFDETKTLKNAAALARLKGYARQAGLKFDVLLKLKNETAPEFIDEYYKKTDWSRYSLVCFTLSYAQIYASFMLAKRIKTEHPDVKTLFGGAYSQIHPDSVEEYMKAFPFIDYFITGEAEASLPQLAGHVKSGAANSALLKTGVEGIFLRDGDDVKTTEGISRIENMDEAPIPDYQGFYDRVQQLPSKVQYHFRKEIPIELSRGCPWGQIKPCTFCAFYPCRDFRPKGGDRILQEMEKQARRHRIYTYYIVDAGVPGEMIKTVFPRFKKIRRWVSIPFIETRTSLKEEHVRIMKNSGVSLVQPGIECLETGLLKKVNKGVSLYNNLNYLKWCRKYDVGVSYNIILNLPDATEKEVENQLRIMKKLIHLHPPYPMFLALVRFSDYLKNWDQYPMTEPEPDSFYRFIHPEGIDLKKVAFEYTAGYARDVETLMKLYQQTVQVVNRWRTQWSVAMKPFFTVSDDGKEAVLEDGRENRITPLRKTLHGLFREIYLHCMERPGTPRSLLKRVKGKFPIADEEGVRRILNQFVSKDWTLKDRGLYYSLAVEKNE